MFFLQIIFYTFADTDPAENTKHTKPLDLSIPEPSEFALQIDTVLAGLSQSIQIRGKGVDNNLLGLWHNGEYSSAAIINNGEYRFPPQSLYLGKNNFLIWSLSQDGKTALVDSFSVQYYSQRLHLLSIPFSRLDTQEKIVSLTFDAGSAANGADSIINILEEKNLKLTFFVTGTFIKKFPRIVQTLLDNGHEVGNHSYSHPHLTSYAVTQTHNSLLHTNRAFIYNQLNKTDSLFHHKFGRHLKPFWRAPFGELNDQILRWAAELGYKHIGWSANCDTRDWVSDKDSDLYSTAEEIYQHLINLESRGNLKGAIVLMHLHTDRTVDQPFTILRKLIDTLRERGYKIVPVSTMLTSSISA
jgi:peptidoglycan/xylan/chitin deacetylase (PgdA/CDA1 family)